MTSPVLATVQREVLALTAAQCGVRHEDGWAKRYQPLTAEDALGTAGSIGCYALVAGSIFRSWLPRTGSSPYAYAGVVLASFGAAFAVCEGFLDEGLLFARSLPPGVSNSDALHMSDLTADLTKCWSHQQFEQRWSPLWAYAYLRFREMENVNVDQVLGDLVDHASPTHVIAIRSLTEFLATWVGYTNSAMAAGVVASYLVSASLKTVNQDRSPSATGRGASEGSQERRKAMPVRPGLETPVSAPRRSFAPVTVRMHKQGVRCLQLV